MTKKEQILKTALKLFIENGFEKTPTSLISKEAGVATGTLFHHFKTKEELIDALYLDVKFSIIETIVSAIDSAKGLKENVHALWFNFISWVLDHHDEYRFIVQFGESSLISTSTRERAEAAFQNSKDYLEGGLKQGIFFNLPMDFLMMLFTSHIFTACNYFLENPQEWEKISLREEVFCSCWNAMAKKS